MVFKDVAVKKYVVRLNAEERAYLDELIRKGKSPAQRLMKARILLKSDVGEGGEGWSDCRIIEALETSASMIYRVRKQLVEEGFEAVLRQTTSHAGCPANFRWRKRGETDCFGLFRASRRACPVDVTVAGGESCGTQYCRQGQRQHDRTSFKKTFSSPISKSNG